MYDAVNNKITAASTRSAVQDQDRTQNDCCADTTVYGMQIPYNKILNFASQQIKKSNTGFMPAHWAVYDAAGQTLIIEMDNLNGVKWYNGTDLGVMTNSPFYPQQVEVIDAHTLPIPGMPRLYFNVPCLSVKEVLRC